MDIKLLLLAVAPVIALGTAIYLLDRREKEPILLLMKVYFLGALTVIPVYLIQKIILGFNVFEGILSVVVVAFVVAGLVEEYAKRAVLMNVAYENDNFNERIDGVVYSVFSALGFATVENIMYIMFAYTGNFYVGIMRGVLSVPAHVLFAITMGYYVSLAKFTDNEKMRKSYLLKSLTVPVLLHGFFNFILMSKLPTLMLFFIPFVVYLWIANIIKLCKLSKTRNNNQNYKDKN